MNARYANGDIGCCKPKSNMSATGYIIAVIIGVRHIPVPDEAAYMA
jgi:hypothetical protein